MITNPFARKPKTPIDQAVDAFDAVRSDAVGYAASVRDAAATIAENLTEIGPPTPRARKLPVVLAIAAAGIGVALVVRQRLSGGSAADQFPAPVPQPAADTAARSTTTPQPAEQPTSAGDTNAEAPSEPKAATSESETATP